MNIFFIVSEAQQMVNNALGSGARQ